MSEEHGDEEIGNGDHGSGGYEGIWTRSTAPQSPYTARQVGIGIVVLVVGAVVAFGLPLAVT